MEKTAAITKFKRVLLIDDDTLSNLIAKMAIDRSGIAEVITAVSGAQQGLQILTADSTIQDVLPDLIFLDLNMPIMDGWEFLEEYKKIEPEVQERIKIVILSSSIFSKDIERAKACKHVFEFVSKPLKVETLTDLQQRIMVSLS